VITDAQHLEATSAPSAARPNVSEPPPSRFFLDYVRETLEAESETSGPRNGGQIVISSVDVELQRAAVDAISGGLAALERDHPGIAERGTASDSPVQAALVAVDPRTGDVLAMVGGRDYGESQFNRAVHARRQPGSSFKPIVTLAALSRSDQMDGGGRPFTLATVLSDQPLEVETPAGPWQPVNYDGRFHGRVSLREALERSLNVPFARLGLEIGPERIVETARKVGIESPVKPYPSIALGAFEVTPLEMARAYGVLATGGYRADSRSVLGILEPDGEVVMVREVITRPVASPAETYLVTSALRGAVERGTGRSLRALGFDGVVAAKSGTTNGFRDGWFIGYTPTLAVAVWVGFDDGQSLGLSGSRVALPIFARFMTAATGRQGDHGPWGSSGFIRPAGLEVVDVDPVTGLRAGPGCSGRPELFLSGTAPVSSCSPYGYRRNASTVRRNDLLQLLRQRARGRER
jgi:penicillin-binding protein 1B